MRDIIYPEVHVASSADFKRNLVREQPLRLVSLLPVVEFCNTRIVKALCVSGRTIIRLNRNHCLAAFNAIVLCQYMNLANEDYSNNRAKRW